MNINKINDALVLVSDYCFGHSFYECKNGKLKECNAFFNEQDVVLRMGSTKVYLSKFGDFLYLYWKEMFMLEIHEFVRLISKNEFDLYLEDAEGEVWVLSKEPLDPDGDIREMTLRLRRKRSF